MRGTKNLVFKDKVTGKEEVREREDWRRQLFPHWDWNPWLYIQSLQPRPQTHYPSLNSNKKTKTKEIEKSVKKEIEEKKQTPITSMSEMSVNMISEISPTHDLLLSASEKSSSSSSSSSEHAYRHDETRNIELESPSSSQSPLVQNEDNVVDNSPQLKGNDNNNNTNNNNVVESDFLSLRGLGAGVGGGMPHLYQGIIALADCPEEVGGFMCVPGITAFLPQWVKERAPVHDKWLLVRVPDDDPMLGYVQKVPLRKGEMVIWDAGQAHGVFPNQSNKMRLYQFVRMMPAMKECEERDRFAARVVCNKYAQFDIASVPLTALGRKLVGLDEWCDDVEEEDDGVTN